MTEILDKLFVFIFIAATVVFVLTLISLPTFAAFLLNRWLIKKRIKYVGMVLLIAAPIWTAYEVYTAFYPADSYYLSEFKEVTLREAPKSAEVVRKTASYPDLHGDYYSVSLIKLSSQDYTDLNEALLADNRIIKSGEFIGSTEFDKVMGDLKMDQINFGFTRQIPNEEDHYLYIGFLDDQQSVIVYVSVT